MKEEERNYNVKPYTPSQVKGLSVIPLFKCKWVNDRGGVKVDRDGFTGVNLFIDSYMSDPFILANQATQVFFIEDSKDKRWDIVMHGKQNIVGVDDVVNEDDYNQFDELPPLSSCIQSLDEIL
ncbi:RNA-directed DNA polymerase, eukaryota, reverse transcriptase zinc-binding domain protein [Tanacetum coccineum]